MALSLPLPGVAVQWSAPVTTSPESGAQYRHFDAMPLGLGVLRGDRVVYANASLLKLIGRRAEDIVGKPIRVLAEFTTTAELLMDRYLRRLRGEPVPPVYETSVSTPEGERRVELSVTVEGQDAVVLVRDVSARARTRAVLQRLAELGAGLPGLRTEEEVLHRVFEGLAELGLSCGYLVPGGGRARLERLRLTGTLTTVSQGGRWPQGLTGAWTPLLERAWREGSAYDAELSQEVCRFTAREPVPEPLARLPQAGFHVAGVRIDRGGRPQAVLVVAAPWLREEALPPLRLFGAQVSAALEAALTISQLSAQNAALTSLNRLASTAATALEPGSFYEPCAEEITCLLGCDALGLFLRTEGLHERVLVYSRGLDESSAAYYSRLRFEGDATTQLLERNTTVVLDVEQCSSPTRENMLRLGFTTLAVVPLCVRSRLVGVFVAAFRQPRQLSVLEQETLQAMGAHCAAAAESHRLLTEVRKRADDLVLIHEVGRNMVATLEMDVLMHVGVEGLALIARAEDAYLLMLDADGKHLVVRASARLPSNPEIMGYRLAASPPESSLSARALHTRIPIVVEDMRHEPRVHQDVQRLTGTTAALVLPLVVRERAIGVAVIAECNGPRHFSASEVERASAISNQLALALEQARLIEDLKKSYAQLARTQEQLVQRERLAALGELSAVVAHEVRNPLAAIFNSVATIRHLIDSANPALRLVDIVGEEADRLNRMVDELLDFARPLSPTPTPVPLPRLLEDSVRGALADSRGPVEVQWAVDTAVPPVLADERMMRQAFLNLALNAVQAMPKGGTLRVVARRAQGSPPEVQVEISDTGPGIPPDVRARIFEPFFTTKAKGTGLGLALVKRIVESHSGRLALETQPGRGTTFRLFLPCELAGNDAPHQGQVRGKVDV
jgi:signal transduction histidine kinase